MPNNSYNINVLKVNNEISRLRKVLLHSPNNELSVLNVLNKDSYLFDEIPNLSIANNEHQIFSNILKDNHVEVVYLLDLMKEVLDKNNIKDSFIKDYLSRQNCLDEKIYQELIAIKDNKELILKTMSGIDGKLKAMPDLYFTRDPFTIIGKGIVFHNMHNDARKSERIYGEYINKYHPDFNGPTYLLNSDEYVEGGDVLLLDDGILAIGISERTTYKGAKALSEKLISDGIISKSLLIEIPSKRSCMHLDTVFNRIDINTFVIYQEILENYKLLLIDSNGLKEISHSLKEELSLLLNIENINLLICEDAYEQWNDACNTLCIGPGEIIVYDDNLKMNELYKKAGIKIYPIPAKELIKGRGGPHCMSMPVLRD